jgi:hypothetical protein
MIKCQEGSLELVGQQEWMEECSSNIKEISIQNHGNEECQQAEMRSVKTTTSKSMGKKHMRKLT